ncbi:MAG TPA: TonB-dependent receptor [Gemmatimonadaceae bacterium]|jgi:TonB-linked SusC/RagA family outer membrane protein|nr:TonB-dependent receptor [Gemmatimonadaceae bacterium]
MSEPTVAVHRKWRAPLLLLALLTIAAVPASAQQRVTGRVTAAGTGAPLVAVQVQAVGTTVGTTTNAEGRYTLTVPATSTTLAFSRLGFNRREIPIAGQSTIDVTLATVATKLEEVVVVGYGEKTRATATESVGSVSREEITQVPAASPEQTLQGRVSGIQVTTESGAPGAPVSVRVRGVGTVGNTQPLYVVDGLPVGRGNSSMGSPLSTINPEDIESISVLKDASAAAIYGVQAANGVVLIQTRRGHAKTPTVEYSGYYGLQNFPKRYEMLNTQQWFDLGQESFDNYNKQFGYAPGSNNARKYTDWLLQRKASLVSGPMTDWQNVIENKNAPLANHFGSVSGNTDRADYFLSGGYFKQAPIIQKFDFQRLSGRANSNIRVSDKVRLGETFTLTRGQTVRGQNNGFNGQLMPNALNLPPFFKYTDDNGSVPNNRYGFTGNSDFGLNAGLTMGNEPALNQIVESTDRDIRLLGGVNGEADLLPGLTLRSAASLDLQEVRNTSYNPSYTLAEIGLDRADNLGEDRQENTSIQWSNTLTYTKSLGKNNFNLLAGTEIQKYHNTITQISTTGLVTQAPAFIEVPSAGNNLANQPRAFAGRSAFLSYLGRANYNFAEKYLFTASVRRDGSSNFAPENRWGVFPAFSAGWRLSQEPWFHVPGVSELKLRGSWGRLGNSDVGASFPYLFQVTTTPDYAFGDALTKAPAPAGFVNRELVWEVSESRDMGFESGFFDNRLSFSANYYTRDTKNFLIRIPLPYTSGFPNGAPVNSGLVNNHGFELESGYEFTAPGGVDIRLNANLTTVKNQLKELRAGINEYSSGGIYRTAVGFPIDYFWGYKTCGIYQSTAAAAAALPDATIGSNKAQAGDVCFADIAGPKNSGPDGKITTDDRTFLGKAIPDYYFGFQMNSNYRAVDLSLFFSGVGGVQKFNAVAQRLSNISGGSGNKTTSVLDHWSETNPNSSQPRAVVQDPNGNDRLSDRWIEDANYFRLKNVQLGYTLPAGVLGLKNSTRVYVAGTNIFTKTPYSGLDPEFSTSVDFARSQNAVQNQAGTDNGFIPQPRTFQFGIRTTF